MGVEPGWEDTSVGWSRRDSTETQVVRRRKERGRVNTTAKMWTPGRSQRDWSEV